MISKPSSMVKIDFDPAKGLLLNWNFRGNINTFFFRHIILLDVGEDLDYQNLVKKYLDKVKFGDIVALCAINKDQQCCFQRWKEKTPVTEIKLDKLKPCLSAIDCIEELFEMIEEKHAQFQEPSISTIITQKQQKQLNGLFQLTSKFISKNKSFCSSIFCAAQTSLQPVTGVNLFNLEDFKSEQSWVFLRHYWSQIALLNVNITIQCQNGSISAQDKAEWQTVYFNRISRELRMPSTIYSYDVIQFLHFDSADEVSYLLDISLKYRELSGKEFVASKKLRIKAMNQKTYQRTIGFGEVEYAIQLAQGFYSKRNPCKSNSLVRFNRNVCGPKGNDLIRFLSFFSNDLPFYYFSSPYFNILKLEIFHKFHILQNKSIPIRMNKTDKSSSPRFKKQNFYPKNNWK